VITWKTLPSSTKCSIAIGNHWGHITRGTEGTCIGCITTPATSSRIALAAAFHDLSFATDQTLDYLPPSILSATEHLETLGLAELAPAVGRMIGFHHKLTPYRDEDANLVEPFRRADLVDLFAVPGVGLPFALRREAQSTYPKCGFRGFVCRTLLLGALKHPLRPMPMLRW